MSSPVPGSQNSQKDAGKSHTREELIMATISTRRIATGFGPLDLGICVLVAATALVHLYLGAATSVMLATQPAQVASLGGAAALTMMAALFYTNFAGYVVLGAARYLPALRGFRQITRWALIGYTGVTVLAYFALAQGQYDVFGFADKACEILLIALLLVDGRRGRAEVHTRL